MIACIGDESGGRAVAGIAAALARRLEARLTLMTVQQTAASGDDATALVRGQSLLTSAGHGFDPPAELRVALGEPAERLLAVSEREAAQLVVVSVPRRSPAHTPLLGNVYLALASVAPCPVVVVPPGVSSVDEGPIVCGVDSTMPSRAAAGVAAGLADRLAARLLLVHASPATILRHIAERVGAQMLVTSSRAGGRDPSVLLGSVASTLAVSAARPVMVVPARF